MRPMDRDEHNVAVAVARFLRDGDDEVPVGKSGLVMTFHTAGHSLADERLAVARIEERDWTKREVVDYEVEIVVRRRS